MKPINERISVNITNLRKSAKLTQLEFAEKINYSDKAISKWENGDSVPSVEVLENICKFFSVSLNEITSETPIEFSEKRKIKLSPNKLIIICLSMIFVWLLATVLFVYSNLIWQNTAWILFIWAVPLSCIVGIVFNSIWGRKKNVYLLLSILIWTLIVSVYINFIEHNAWVIFLLGIPLQISVVLWSQLNGERKTQKMASKITTSDKQNEQLQNNSNDKI